MIAPLLRRGRETINARGAGAGGVGSVAVERAGTLARGCGKFLVAIGIAVHVVFFQELDFTVGGSIQYPKGLLMRVRKERGY